MNASPVAGHSVRVTSRQHYERGGLYGLIGAALLALGILIGSDGAAGTGALLGAIGLVVAAEARHRLQLARRFEIGAIAEERVGSRLWVLEDSGWLVAQDVEKEGGGNVDHVVQSPAVTFLIETKASRWHERDLAQVRRHARWAAVHYGPGRELVSVICVQRSKQRPQLVDGVYVVGAPHLVEFLRDRG